MKTQKQSSILALFLLMLGCNAAPQPIDYGSDGCSYCKMTIVDKTHAAEIVTTKNKAYKFDATECLVNFMHEFDTSDIELYLVSNYSEPGTLVDAKNATFLISKNIPSPMGAFISAFNKKAGAETMQAEKGGDLYSWEELRAHLKD